MLFNSFEYLIFLPIVFVLYWKVFTRNLQLQNGFLLLVSYLFYGWWDWRFLLLIAFSSLVDYNIGIRLDKTTDNRRRKLLLYLSLFVNLGLLGYFKYCNFFIYNFKIALESFGFHAEYSSLQIILPVGISFYTFQTLSYTIDIYRGNLKPTRNAIQFFAYVSFFPQLVAGPIERAKNLLPQFKISKQFDINLFSKGFNQIVWGFFKKVVIADSCALYVNQIFDAPQDFNSVTLILGAVLFAFQIYCDFSGYSDIAIGTAKLFGFDLMKNFNYPYFSRDIAEFWRRWHISLSTWFRDYLYIPLGGSKGGTISKIRNTFIIFIVSGFWHGANWTFVFWGFLNALFFLPLLVTNKNRKFLNTVAEGRKLPTFKEFLQISFTFTLTTLAWVFFRANSLTEAFIYIKSIFAFENTFSIKSFYISGIERYSFEILPLILFFILLEWMNRRKDHPINNYKMLLFISILIIIFGEFSERSSFIYFQF
ncbi:MBOAT family protein [Flavobacteriaceae bacterium]|nr:MBOAT family protein [Flavobacteriaceae bacterium]